MSHHDLILLNHLSKQVLLLYCQHGVELSMLGKLFIRDHLMPLIAQYLEIDYSLLPDEQVFYRALRGKFCSSGMKEKLAAFYIAIKNPQNKAEMKNYCLKILSRERLTFTPCWNEFVKEYEEQKKKAKKSMLPARVKVFIKKLKPSDRKVLYEWLKIELENGRIGASGN